MKLLEKFGCGFYLSYDAVRHGTLTRGEKALLVSRSAPACLALVALALSTRPPIATAADGRPNVVFFLADDLGYMDVGANNPKTFYETPNIDRLARNGIRFTQGYAACPVCSPTRASIMTGKYPVRTGITDYIPGQRNAKLLSAPNADHLALEEVTIAERFRDAGYATFFAGKWHLGGGAYSPNAQGFGPGLV
jgi:arylsulfatase A-like enzyme